MKRLMMTVAMGMAVAGSALAGAISGTVTAPNGTTGLSGIEVTAYSEVGSGFVPGPSVFTAANGTYTLSGLGAGSYVVGFWDSAGTYIPEYYNNVADAWDGTAVVVGASGTVGGINASLALASKIAGQVTKAGGGGVSNVTVEAYVWNSGYWDWVDSVSGAANGTYTIGGLAAGTYRVGFEPQDPAYASEFYNNKLTLAEGDSIAVPVTGVVSSINAVLEVGASIRGTITGPNGVTPLGDINVEVYRVPTGGSGDLVWMNDTWSASDGTYVMSGLPAGTYRLAFNDYSDQYLQEYYNNAETLSAATDVVVPAGAAVTGINASLAAASSIAGRVTGANGTTPLVDIQVVAWVSVAGPFPGFYYWNWYQSADTDTNGNYRIWGLAPGTYRVSFEDGNGQYALEYYDNVSSVEEATDVIVPSGGGAVSGINASLGVAAKITGRVTGPNGTTPVFDADVTAYRWNGNDWDWLDRDDTDTNGVYAILGLPAGTYRVEFEDYNGQYVGEYYNDAADLDSATDIAVAAGATVGNINASLARAASIAGRVTAPNGVTPLADVDVMAYTFDGSWWNVEGWDSTDTNGEYRLTGLAAGTYRVGFADNSGLYLDEYYHNATSLDTATDVIVPASTDVTGINESLTRAARILGTVRAADTQAGLADVPVSAFRFEVGSWNYKGETDTDGTGSYVLGGLAETGLYAVVSYPLSGPYVGQWYNGVPAEEYNGGPPAGVTLVTVLTGADTNGVNFALARGAVLQGVVYGETTPLANARVVLNGGGGVTTDAAGHYRHEGLYAGDYEVKVEAERWQDVWWSNAHHIAQAELLPISTGQVRTIDFRLDWGQSTALVYVTSSPTGAVIYLDHQSTGLKTPAMIDAGERTLNTADETILPHIIQARLPGYPWPAPQEVDVAEGETTDVYFYLGDPAAGSVRVVTTPAGASVYVDGTDAAIGVSPITVTNLAPGSHTVILQRNSYLRPAPINATIVVEEQTDVTVSLVATSAAPYRPSVTIQTLPSQASVYVDYSPPVFTSAVLVANLDPVASEGTNWVTGAHAVLLRKTGYIKAAPRLITAASNGVEIVSVELLTNLPTTSSTTTTSTTSTSTTSTSSTSSSSSSSTTSTTSTSSTSTAPGMPVGNAMDQAGLTWTGGGNRAWFGQTSVTHDGVDAAQSGAITHNQTSWMQTTITGGTSIGFWWSLSAETNDTLTVSLDGVQKLAAGGTQAWRYDGFYIPSGVHTVRWTYAKNASLTQGSDAAWVDGLTLGLFGAATPLGGGWYWSEWFGFYSANFSPWLYHNEHGWIYPFGQDPGSVVFYDSGMGTFWWTSEALYSFLYRFGDDSWMWYEEGSTNPRWLLNLRTGSWESE
jgi:hypothetical protein